MTDLINSEAVPGHNGSPEPTPLELSAREIGDLAVEARAWCDGTPIANEDQAVEVGNLLRELRAARDRADERRKADKKPWDDGAQAVQDAYAPLIADTKKVKGTAVRAIEGCKALADAWLAKEEARKRAEAEAARREADERARIAREAMAASDASDMAGRERAELLVRQAAEAGKVATRAEKDRATIGGDGRAISRRTSHEVTLTDSKAALRYAVEHWPDDLKTWLTQRAQQDADRGVLTIAGFDVTERRSAA